MDDLFLLASAATSQEEKMDNGNPRPIAIRERQSHQNSKGHSTSEVSVANQESAEPVPLHGLQRTHLLKPHKMHMNLTIHRCNLERGDIGSGAGYNKREHQDASPKEEKLRETMMAWEGSYRPAYVKEYVPDTQGAPTEAAPGVRLGFRPPCVWIVSGEDVLGSVPGSGLLGRSASVLYVGGHWSSRHMYDLSPPTNTEPVQQEQLVNTDSCHLITCVRQMQDLTGGWIRSEISGTTLGTGEQGPGHGLKKKCSQKSPKLPRNVTIIDPYLDHGASVHGSRPSDQEPNNSESLGEQLMESKKGWESICKLPRGWSQCKTHRLQTQKQARSKAQCQTTHLL